MSFPPQKLLEQLAKLDRRYAELEEDIAQLAGQRGTGSLPAPPARQAGKALQQRSKELSDLREIVLAYRTYLRVERDAVEAEQLFHAQGDLEMRELAKDEAYQLRQQQVSLLVQLEALWAERTQAPERPLIIEIRAGTGGLEASLFVADLYRMYTKYASKVGLKVEPMHGQPSEAGGFKEVAFAVNGPGEIGRA